MRRWLRAADLYEAAGHTTVPIAIEEIRAMATKSIGKISKKALAEGKVQPSTRTPPHFAAAKKAKADRVEAGLRKNRLNKRSLDGS